jgi:hypothetical protein
MAGPIRKKLGPVRKRVKDQINEAKTLREEDVKNDNVGVLISSTSRLLAKLIKNFSTLQGLEDLQECAKSDVTEDKKLAEEAEATVVLELNTNEAIATLETMVHELSIFRDQVEESGRRKEQLAHEEKMEVMKLEKQMVIERETMERRLQMEKESMAKKDNLKK